MSGRTVGVGAQAFGALALVVAVSVSAPAQAQLGSREMRDVSTMEPTATLAGVPFEPGIAAWVRDAAQAEIHASPWPTMACESTDRGAALGVVCRLQWNDDVLRFLSDRYVMDEFPSFAWRETHEIWRAGCLVERTTDVVDADSVRWTGTCEDGVLVSGVVVDPYGRSELQREWGVDRVVDTRVRTVRGGEPTSRTCTHEFDANQSVGRTACSGSDGDVEHTYEWGVDEWRIRRVEGHAGGRSSTVTYALDGDGRIRAWSFSPDNALAPVVTFLRPWPR